MSKISYNSCLHILEDGDDAGDDPDGSNKQLIKIINYGEYHMCLYILYYLDSSIVLRHSIKDFFINGTEIKERCNLSMFIY